MVQPIGLVVEVVVQEELAHHHRQQKVVLEEPELKFPGFQQRLEGH